MNYKLTLPTEYDVEITAQDFKNYVDVQMGGQYNMFDPNARIAAGLTKKQFMVIMKNYEELEEQYQGADVEEDCEEEDECYACCGTGKYLETVHDCDECDGAGVIAQEQKTDCPECYGTGYWEPYLDQGDRTEEDCPNCDGEGVI